MAILVFAPFYFPGDAFGAEISVLRKYFTASGLPNNWIKGIFRDGGTVLVTAGDDRTGATVALDPGRDRFVPFDPGQGFAGKGITGWAEYGGKSYAGTESALNIRDGISWSHLDGFGPVRHSGELLYNAGKTLYAVARVMAGGVLSFDGKEWRIVNRGPGTGIMNNATAVLSDGENLYIGTTTNGLFRFDGRAWTVIGAAEGLPGTWVTSLALTDEGLWIGCNDGLALLVGKKIRTFSGADGLPSRRIRTVRRIRGRLFVGTADAGLSIRTGERFETLSTDRGLSDPRIQAIEEAPEGAWVGTVNGLNLLSIRD
ncbi:MAG: hypothetical protein WC899_09255 [bacterium]